MSKLSIKETGAKVGDLVSADAPGAEQFKVSHFVPGGLTPVWVFVTRLDDGQIYRFGIDEMYLVKRSEG